jgi:hypothetical protein
LERNKKSHTFALRKRKECGIKKGKEEVEMRGKKKFKIFSNLFWIYKK